MGEHCYWDENFVYSVTESYAHAQSTCKGSNDQGPSPQYEICDYWFESKEMVCHAERAAATACLRRPTARRLWHLALACRRARVRHRRAQRPPSFSISCRSSSEVEEQ